MFLVIIIIIIIFTYHLRSLYISALIENEKLKREIVMLTRKVSTLENKNQKISNKLFDVSKMLENAAHTYANEKRSLNKSIIEYYINGKKNIARINGLQCKIDRYNTLIDSYDIYLSYLKKSILSIYNHHSIVRDIIFYNDYIINHYKYSL